MHSKLDESSTARTLKEKIPEEIKHLAPELTKTIHGTFGMEDFSLKTLNRTTDLANRIIIENEHKKLKKGTVQE